MATRKGTAAEESVARLQLKLWNTIAVQLGGAIRWGMLALALLAGVKLVEAVEDLVSSLGFFALLATVSVAYIGGLLISRRQVKGQRDSLIRLRAEKDAVEAQLRRCMEHVERLVAQAKRS